MHESWQVDVDSSANFVIGIKGRDSLRFSDIENSTGQILKPYSRISLLSGNSVQRTVSYQTQSSATYVIYYQLITWFFFLCSPGLRQCDWPESDVIDTPFRATCPSIY